MVKNYKIKIMYKEFYETIIISAKNKIEAIQKANKNYVTENFCQVYNCNSSVKIFVIN